MKNDMEARVASCSLHNTLFVDAVPDTLLVVENVRAWMPVCVFTATVPRISRCDAVLLNVQCVKYRHADTQRNRQRPLQARADFKNFSHSKYTYPHTDIFIWRK
jgi:hypothetical protein